MRRIILKFPNYFLCKWLSFSNVLPFIWKENTLCGAFTVWFDAIEKNIATSFHYFCFLRTILSLLFLQKVARKWQFVFSMLECPAGKKYCRLLLLLQLSNTPFLDKSLSKSKPFVHFSPGFNCKRKKVGQLSGNLCHQGGGGPTPNGKIHFKFLFPLYR